MTSTLRSKLVRLFVGIDVPAAIADALVQSGPRGGPGVRVVHAEDLHLTLHFIGAADPERLATALEDVRASQFSLEIAGLGQFRMAGGRRILWAGVNAEPRLLGLHRRVGAALATTGFVPEKRRYLPHVTLARIKRQANTVALDRLVSANAGTSFGRFAVNEFILYDTDTPDAAVRYRRIRRYPLIGAPASRSERP